MRIFGAEAYALVPKELRRKLDDHSELGHFVGYKQFAYLKMYGVLSDTSRSYHDGILVFGMTGQLGLAHTDRLQRCNQLSSSLAQIADS